MTTRRPVVVVTRSLPYGPKEAFLVPELRILAERDNVIILPSRRGGALVHGDARPLCELVPTVGKRARWALRAVLDIRGCLATISVIVRVARRLPRRRALRTLTMLPRALTVLGATKAVHARHVHAYWATDPATIALAATSSSRVRWSFTAHRYDIAVDEVFAEKADDAQFVRFISRSGAAMAAARCKGYNSGREQVIHLGVDIPAEPGTGPTTRNDVVIGCAAAFIPVKGHDTLLAAFADATRTTATEARLILFGDGPLRETLVAQVAALQIEHLVEFAGTVAHDRLLGHYKSRDIDVLVLASRDMGNGVHEGIPVSLMEAMAYGVPVVATATGGVAELVTDAGVVVKDDDVGSLAAALRQLIEDEQARVQLGERGRKRVFEQFNASQTSGELLASINAASDV